MISEGKREVCTAMSPHKWEQRAEYREQGQERTIVNEHCIRCGIGRIREKNGEN